jgi:hypothetical protein
MPWETVFSFANLWALPFWLLLAFAPRSELTGRIILFGGIAPLAFVYAVLLPLIMSGAVDPVGPETRPLATYPQSILHTNPKQLLLLLLLLFYALALSHWLAGA